MRSTVETRRRVALHDRFGYRVAVLARRWRQLVDAELEAYGLSQATWRPLIHLSEFDRPPRQCELADALQIGGPALVRLLDNLEDKGLIARVAVDGDRRANHVELTRDGKKLAARVHQIIAEIERELVRDVAPAALATCDRALDAIGRRIDRHHPTRPTPRATPRATRRRA